MEAASAAAEAPHGARLSGEPIGSEVFMQLFRRVVRQLHLWLGLVTGAVVFVVAVTGCCWVFQEEIRGLSEDYRTVEPKNAPFISPTEARRIAERRLPGKAIHGLVYGTNAEALEIVFYEREPEFYRSVFLDPYSGKVLKVVDHLEGFFAFVLDGHLHLWLPEAVGQQVVSWSTLLFIVMLGSGLFLWWPRGKRNRKQKFWLAWKPGTKWRRKNYDLHSIAGMYVSALALVSALTGLIMAFDWFEKGFYRAMGGDKKVQFVRPESASPGSVSASLAAAEPVRSPLDRLLSRLRKEYPTARSFELHEPASRQSSIYVEIAYQDGVYYDSDYRFYNPSTLEELDSPSLYGAYEDAELADKVIRMNYDTHVGSILGLPGKILMFSASLIVASLPITGFLFWWGRRKKSKQAARSATGWGKFTVATRV